MKNHKVCVITCPHCGHEKALTRLDERCVIIFQCKICRAHCKAIRNQECFEFEGLVAANM